MAQLWNMARMTSTTTGTSTVTLGAAVASFNTFVNAGVTNGSCIAYAIFEGTNREMGLGVYSSLTLTRVPTASTAGGAAINLTGASEVFVTPSNQQIGNLTEANTWSKQQTFYSSASGALPMNIYSDASDAASGPFLFIERGSTSPANNDYIGEIQFAGRDAGGNFANYGSMTAKIIDVSSGAFDGALVLSTPTSGVDTERIYVGQGLYTANSVDKGQDSISAALHFASSAILSNSPAGGVGYTTGAGVTVAQSASGKNVAVIANGMSGQITTSSAALASAATVSFNLNSSGITGSDAIVVNHFAGGTFGAYNFTSRCLSSGLGTINIRNLSSVSLSEALILHFAIIRGALS